MAPAASVFSSYGIFSKGDTALHPRISSGAVFNRVLSLEGDLPGHQVLLQASLLATIPNTVDRQAGTSHPTGQAP